jgi:hypothetical protein
MIAITIAGLAGPVAAGGLTMAGALAKLSAEFIIWTLGAMGLSECDF